MNMREDLKAFVDNEVSEAERTRILREIEADPELQAEVIELRQISRIVKEEAWQPQPVGLEKTLRALSSGGANASRKPWWLGPAFQWAIGSACVIVIAAIIFPVFAQSKESAKRAAWISASRQAESSDQAGFTPSDGGVQSPASSPTYAGKFPSVSKGDFARSPSGGGGGEMAPAPNAEMPAAVASPNTAVLGTRLEIKTAQLSVEVEDVPKAQSEAESIAKAVSGRVESSAKNNDEGTLATAELTLRVPVASFPTAVNRLRNLGRVISDNLTGQDVTTQVVDVEARLKVMRAEEDQYVELLKAANKVGEVLSVRERLGQVRQEIESLDATRKALRDQASESTIHLSLSERPKPDRPQQNENWAEDAWSTAVNGLSAAGRAIGKTLVFLFVFSPIWLPAVMLAWWLVRRANR
jgi:hypothetical protein